MKNIIVYLTFLFFIILYIFYYSQSYIEPFEDFLRFGYIINLDERTDRLNNIIKAFEKYNLPLYRISAIRNSVGWKGCGYSHVSIIKMAKISMLPSVLILEDDCIPTEHFNNWFIIQDWLERHRDKWDIFIGGNGYYGFWTKQTNTIEPLCKIDNIKLYKTSNITSFQFYYVNSRVYDKMIEWEEYINSSNEWIPIDMWPSKIGLNCISCTPFLAIQTSSHSDIEGSVRDYQPMMATSENVIASIENNSTCEPFQNFSTFE